MILAAGLGTRLRPLTDIVPKPLVPVANQPLIRYTLALLERAGVREAAINLHHLGEQIRSELGERAGRIALTYSPEREILGTGGGVVRMRHFLEGGTFLLLNGDVLSAVDLSAALDFHRCRGFAATMVVRPLPAGAGYTALEADEADRMVGFKDLRVEARGRRSACMFCGIHVLEPEVFDFLPDSGFACINDRAYRAMLGRGLEIGACPYDGPWFDLGTVERYLDANLAALSGQAALGCGFPELDADGVLIAPDARIAPSARLGPRVAVGEDCVIEQDAWLEDSVIWPHTRIRAGSRLQRAVAAGDLRVGPVGQERRDPS
ncbi:MAG: NDP-sugar synthase [Deltaproteobacteria bacterium]|nr:NDP-sugar synthase [Deltaproteobacteria bacterium]